MNSLEKYFYIFLITLTVFTIGVQVGIHHGRKLQLKECQESFFAFSIDNKNYSEGTYDY